MTEPTALAAFLAGEAAFIAQKSTTDFCRVRAGLDWKSLAGAEEFGLAIERCRWTAYAACLTDLAECCQILFRHAGLVDVAGPERLGPVLHRALHHHGPPTVGPSLLDHEPAITRRLALGLMAGPRQVKDLADTSGAIVFDHLPLKTDLTKIDRELVMNSIRFLMCSSYQNMERAVDAAAVARVLRQDAAG